MSQQERDLIQSVVEGNVDDFEPLIKAYQGVVFATALSIVKDFCAAQDVAQESFITAFEKLATLKNPLQFGAWLLTIARNRARMWVRSQKRLHATFVEFERAASVPEHVERELEIAPAEEVDRQAFYHLITAVLLSMPKSKRMAVMLCYINGVPRKTAAHLLRVRENTLRKRLHDAKKYLQKRIVEAAEKTLRARLLPRDFAARCICGCRMARKTKTRAKLRETKEVGSMPSKKNCGCGCVSPPKKRSGQKRRKPRPKKK